MIIFGGHAWTAGAVCVRSAGTYLARASEGCIVTTKLSWQLGQKLQIILLFLLGREGVGDGSFCRLDITELLSHGRRGAQGFPAATSSTSPAAPEPLRCLLAPSRCAGGRSGKCAARGTGNVLERAGRAAPGQPGHPAQRRLASSFFWGVRTSRGACGTWALTS